MKIAREAVCDGGGKGGRVEGQCCNGYLGVHDLAAGFRGTVRAVCQNCSTVFVHVRARSVGSQEAKEGSAEVQCPRAQRYELWIVACGRPRRRG